MASKRSVCVFVCVSAHVCVSKDLGAHTPTVQRDESKFKLLCVHSKSPQKEYGHTHVTTHTRTHTHSQTHTYKHTVKSYTASQRC